jgi:glycosyltransferase involved in cell wall biosynthesis
VPYLEKQRLVLGVDYGDAEDMANKILDSVRNSDVTKRKLIGRRAFLTKEFDIENFLDSLLNIVN